MFWNIRLIPAWLLAAALLVLAACGSGGGNDSNDSATNAGDGGGEPAAFVLNGTEALGRSAQSFSEDVQSVSGTFEFTFGAGEEAMSGNADFAFKAPDSMHMTMSFDSAGGEASLIDLGELGQFEMIMRDGVVYMNIPLLGGWFKISPEDFGEDSTSIEDLLSQGSVFDYSGFLGDINGDVDFVGEEQVNGHATNHYHFSGTIQDLIDSFASALASSGDESGFGDLLTGADLEGTIDVDIWVGTDDQLPYMMLMSGNVGDFVMSMKGTFDDYNEDVDIPEAPDDAQSLEELFGDLGETFGETE